VEEDYNPSRREIGLEFLNGTHNSFNRYLHRMGNFPKNFKSSASKNIKSVAIFTFYSTALAVFTASLPYVIPTVTRAIKNSEKSPIPSNVEKSIATGYFVGLMVDALQAAYYVSAIMDKDWKTLLIPASTNLASGGYELYRKVSHDARQRLIDRRRVAKELSDILK